MVVRERTIGEKDELGTSFFITSLALKVRSLAAHIRGHWGIENSQHHVLDVTFAEDASRIRSGITLGRFFCNLTCDRPDLARTE